MEKMYEDISVAIRREEARNAFLLGNFNAKIGKIKRRRHRRYREVLARET